MKLASSGMLGNNVMIHFINYVWSFVVNDCNEFS